MAEYKRKIIGFLSSGSRLVALCESAGGSMLALAFILFSASIIFILNGLFPLETGARSILFIIWSALSIIAIARWIIIPWAFKPNLRTIAISLENAYPSLRSRLVSAFDFLSIDANKFGYSEAIVRAAVEDASDKIKDLRVKKIAPINRIRDRFAHLGGALILTIGLAAAFPATFYNGAYRTLTPFKNLPKPTYTTLIIEPGDTTITKYDDLKISISVIGRIPHEIFVFRSFDGGKERGFLALKNPKNERQWTFIFDDVKRDFTFRVEGGDFSSEKYFVKVIDRPRILTIALTLDYPDYTGIETQRIEENDGTVDVPYGTHVKFDARFSKKIGSGLLVFDDTSKIDMKIDGDKGTASFRAIRSGSYHIRLIDLENLDNNDPIEYPVRIRMDEFPSVEITRPGMDIDLTDDMLVDLSILAEDDYGFSRFNLAFFVEKNPSDTNRIKLPFEAFKKREVGLNYVWNLSRLNIFPEDVVLYWIEAFDNDALTGPKLAVSKTYSARFPSIDQIIKEVTGEREKQVRTVEEALAKERDLAKDMANISRELNRSKEISYEQREDLREALQKQQELIDQLQKTAEEYEKTTEKINEQQLAAVEIIQKMLEIQKILNEIATEEMLEAMRKLQEALNSMDPEQLRRAAEQFKMTQQELLERLDRTLALLKRIQIEQRVEDMKALANKLKEMQDQIKEGLQNGTMSKEDMERMQDRITEGSRLLEDGVKEIPEMMKEFPDMPSDKAQSISDGLQQNKPSEGSKQCKSSMQSGSNKQCMSKAGELSEQFDRTAQQLAQLQKDMQMMISAEVLATIRRAVFSLLDLSKRQEALMVLLQKDPRNTETARANATTGADLYSALIRITNEVYQASQKSMLIPPSVGALLGSSMSNLKRMLDELGQGRGYSAVSPGLDAMATMNLAAEKLLETMDEMSKQGSSSSGAQSFFQRMQGMCNSQCDINAQTVPIAQAQGQPGGLSPDQQAAAARLASEQEALKKSMDELAKEAGRRSDIAGRMDDIVSEMEKVAEDLRRKKADEKTLERQDRILSRMLDVQKSLHKQDYEEKRVSRTGEDIARKSPDRLPDDLGERRDVLQQQLLRALNQPYPKEYEGLIKAYFKSLREQKTETTTP